MVLLEVFAIAIIMVSQVTEAWVEPFQISKIDFFAKTVTCSPLTIFAKFPHLRCVARF